MRKLFLFFILIAFMAGCSNDMEERVSPIKGEAVLVEKVAPYYDVESGMWLQPINDPYSLENFQRAYDDLSTHVSPFSGQLASALPSVTLEPTHYHLKIKPRSERELKIFYSMEDVTIGSFPFNTDMPTKEDAEKLKLSTAGSMGVMGSTETRYFEYPEVILDESKRGLPPEPYMLPIIYAIWPSEKPLPEESDYEITYDIFLPKASAKQDVKALSASSMELTEKEAIRRSGWGGGGGGGSLKPVPVVYPGGWLVSYDSQKEANVPLVNLKVRMKFGSDVDDVYTDSNGYFRTKGFFLADTRFKAFLYFIYEYEDKWIITDANRNLLTIQGPVLTNCNSETTTDLTSFESDIHRATNFWFNGSHEVTKDVRNKGTKMEICAKGRNNMYNGLFCYTHIEIYNNKRLDFFLINTVTHEWGHASEFFNRTFNGMVRRVDNVIIESWASFTGWYVTEMYYRSIGIIPTSTHYGEQKQMSWHINTHEYYSPYSPLFIDLRDDYNQSVPFGPNYPNDNIKDVPVPTIEWIALNSSDIVTFRANAEKFIDVYYTQQEFEEYFDAYTKNWVR